MQFFFKMADLGVGLTTEEAGKRILLMVNDGTPRRNPWKDGRPPGRDFWEGFMRRHPEVSKRTPEALKKARAQQDNVYVYNHFFDVLEGLVDSKKYLPRNIYNDDETMAKFNQGSVLARRGEKTVYVLEDAEWPHITVLSCINAAGEFLEPLVIMSGKTIMEKWGLNETIPGTIYTATESGWIDRGVYTSWFVDAFVPRVNATRGRQPDGSPQPVLLVFDGHDSHISLDVAEAAEKNGIDLLQLPAHTSHRLQPLDVSCFGPWHRYLSREVQTLKINNPYLNINRDFFAQLMGPAYARALSKENILSGFAHSGVYPVDRNKVLHKLMTNAADATRLTPGVAIDPRPNPAYTAPTPVAPVAFNPTPTKALNRMAKTTLRYRIEELEAQNHELKIEASRERSARIDTVLRLPLRDATNVTNAASAPAGKKRSIGALRSEDGKARVVTLAQLRAAIEDDAKAKEAGKNNKRTAASASSSTATTKKLKTTQRVVLSDDDNDTLNLDDDD